MRRVEHVARIVWVPFILCVLLWLTWTVGVNSSAPSTSGSR